MPLRNWGASNDSKSKRGNKKPRDHSQVDSDIGLDEEEEGPFEKKKKEVKKKTGRAVEEAVLTQLGETASKKIGWPKHPKAKLRSC